MNRHAETQVPARRPRILPALVPLPTLAIVAAAVGVSLSLFVAPRIDPRWRPLLDPWACVSHGALVALLVTLAADSLQLRRWSKELDAFSLGEVLRPTWASEALQFCYEQFDQIPPPDAVQAKLREWRSIWEGRLEWRSNAFLVFGVLLGLPLQLTALERVADAGADHRSALRAAIAPLALGGLEVLAVGLPALIIRRGWHDVFETWVPAAGRESNRRRFAPYANPSPAKAVTPPAAPPLPPPTPEEYGSSQDATSYAMPADLPPSSGHEWDFDAE